MKIQTFLPYYQAKNAKIVQTKSQNLAFGLNLSPSLLDRIELNFAIRVLNKFKKIISGQLIESLATGNVKMPNFAYPVIGTVKDNSLRFFKENKNHINALVRIVKNKSLTFLSKNVNGVRDFANNFAESVIKKILSTVNHKEVKSMVDGGIDFTAALLADNKKQLYKVKDNFLNLSDDKVGKSAKRIVLNVIDTIKEKLFAVPDDVFGKNLKKIFGNIIDFIAADKNKLAQNYAKSTFKTASGSAKHEVKDVITQGLKNLFGLN